MAPWSSPGEIQISVSTEIPNWFKKIFTPFKCGQTCAPALYWAQAKSLI